MSCNSAEIVEARVGHSARNAELLVRLRSSGIDLTEARCIDLHFWAANEQSARDLSNRLTTEGYSVIRSVPSSLDKDLWNVEAQIEAAVDEVTRDEFAFQLIDLACAANARFDGWGTAI